MLPDELAKSEDQESGRVGSRPDGAEALKRSVYIMQRRQLQGPFLNVMDAPALNESCPVPGRIDDSRPGVIADERSQSVYGRGKVFRGPRDREGRTQRGLICIQLAFQLAFARPPKLAQLREGAGVPEQRRYANRALPDLIQLQ